jgi:hypothetical protein
MFNKAQAESAGGEDRAALAAGLAEIGAPPRALGPVVAFTPPLVHFIPGSLSLCTAAHPLRTRLANIFGAAASEAAMRPNPRRP